MGVKTIKGKKVPIKNSNSGKISFYDVGQRAKVSIDRSKVKSQKMTNGRYRLTAPAPKPSKSGKEYSLHTFSTTPA